MAERFPSGPSPARSLPFASNSSIFAYGALLGCLFLPSQTTTLSASLPSAIAKASPLRRDRSVSTLNQPCGAYAS